MKSLKAAAVIASSMIVAGAAVPAVAHGDTEAVSPGLVGTTEQLSTGNITVQSLKHASNAVDTETGDSELRSLKGAKRSLDEFGSRLDGGIPPRG